MGVTTKILSSFFEKLLQILESFFNDFISLWGLASIGVCEKNNLCLCFEFLIYFISSIFIQDKTPQCKYTAINVCPDYIHYKLI